MRAVAPAESRPQPVAGAMPPAVLTRWMLVTLLNVPCGPFDFALSSSQGMAPLDGRVGARLHRCDDAAAVGGLPVRPRAVPADRSCRARSKSSASGATKAHSKPAPASFFARHS